MIVTYSGLPKSTTATGWAINIHDISLNYTVNTKNVCIWSKILSVNIIVFNKYNRITSSIPCCMNFIINVSREFPFTIRGDSER